MNKKILTGVVWALIIGFAITVMVSGMAETIPWGWLPAFLIALAMLLLLFFGSSGAVGLIKLIARIDRWLLIALGFGLTVAFIFFMHGVPAALIVFAAITIPCVLIGMGVQLLRRERAGMKRAQRILSVVSLVVGICTLAGGLVWILYPGKPVEMPQNAALSTENLPPLLEMENPGEPGPLEVCTLSYGSGKDKHRKVFSELTPT